MVAEILAGPIFGPNLTPIWGQLSPVNCRFSTPRGPGTFCGPPKMSQGHEGVKMGSLLGKSGPKWGSNLAPQNRPSRDFRNLFSAMNSAPRIGMFQSQVLQTCHRTLTLSAELRKLDIDLVEQIVMHANTHVSEGPRLELKQHVGFVPLGVLA